MWCTTNAAVSIRMFLSRLDLRLVVDMLILERITIEDTLCIN